MGNVALDAGSLASVRALLGSHLTHSTLPSLGGLLELVLHLDTRVSHFLRAMRRKALVRHDLPRYGALLAFLLGVINVGRRRGTTLSIFCVRGAHISLSLLLENKHAGLRTVVAWPAASSLPCWHPCLASCAWLVARAPRNMDPPKCRGHRHRAFACWPSWPWVAQSTDRRRRHSRPTTWSAMLCTIDETTNQVRELHCWLLDDQHEHDMNEPFATRQGTCYSWQRRPTPTRQRRRPRLA